MPDKTRYAVAYDVSSDGRRRRVRRTLRRYGAWRQYSVFEVEVSETQRVELEDDLSSCVDPDEGDRIRLYRLCSACVDATTDIGAEPPDDQSNVV